MSKLQDAVPLHAAAAVPLSSTGEVRPRASTEPPLKRLKNITLQMLQELEEIEKQDAEAKKKAQEELAEREFLEALRALSAPDPALWGCPLVRAIIIPPADPHAHKPSARATSKRARSAGARSIRAWRSQASNCAEGSAARASNIRRL